VNRSYQLIAVAVLSTLAAAASAKVIASGIGLNFFTFDTSGTYVPILSNGGTLLTVNAPKTAKYVITYSAECSVEAPAGNIAAFVDIDVEVNGLGVAPTTGDTDVFCGADGVAGFGSWSHPSVTVVANLTAGPNNIRVLGKFHGGATGGWISDGSIVVHQ